MGELKKRITIVDLAEAAGVSKATAGRVIGNYGSVSEEIRQKVLDAARRLEYSPNAIAQGLRSSNTKTIAAVVGSIKNNFCNQVVYAIEREAMKKGYNVFICNTHEKMDEEIKQLTSLRSRRVDGIILISASLPSKKIANQYIHLYKGYPTVLVDREIVGFKKDLVTSDNFAGSYEATKYLIDMGHKKIGVIATADYSTVLERKRGYIKALEDAGIEYNPEIVLTSAAGEWSGRDLVIDLLKKNKGITGLLILNNSICAGALKGIREIGLSVPEDISIISWDDEELNELLGITTIVQQVEEMGKLAVNRMFDIIGQPNNSGDTILITLGTRLQKRNSCARPRLGDIDID